MTFRVSGAAASVFLLICFGFINTFAQCPDGTNLSSNGFCFIVSWEEVPNPLPTEIDQNGIVYTYQSGTGTISDPAIYQSGGGGGSCQANQDPFSGTIIVDGMECDYTDGNLNPPLPIELVEFKGTLINREVLLQWSTAEETSNMGFDIQNSADGSVWESLIWVDGADNSSDLINYSAIDHNLYSGNNYYRLRQFDFDGAFEYSPIVVVFNGRNYEELKIYPNPANDILFVEGCKDGDITFVNTVGVSLLSYQVKDNQMIDISMLPPGVYFIRNSVNGKALKLIKT